jgi:putative two-component system response regulator
MIADDAASARLLLVDDEEVNVRLLTRILEGAGYTAVRSTVDPRRVEQMIDEIDPDLLLLDLRMPHIDGFGILKRIAPRLNGGGNLPVLMLTGDATPEVKRRALSLGAKDFVAKPFDAGEVLLRIRNLLETRFLHQALERQNNALETRVKARTHELDESQLDIVERLARAGEIRDDATGRHTYRVANLSALIAEALGSGTRFVELIRRAAPLHDVGKIGIPDSILLKAGKLTVRETRIVQSHAVIGARILSGGKSELVKMAERIALSHHERWNGRGYPNRLAGEAIPFEARIVGLADFIDALTHARPYRAAWPPEAVLAEVRGESGKHFDPAVVAALFESRCYEPMFVKSVLTSQEVAIGVSGDPH